MFVLGVLPDRTTLPVTDEFAAKMAAYSVEIPPMPQIPAVTLLGEKRDRPDPRSRDYILISERLVNRKAKARFNTRPNVNTRAVTITGVELIWSRDDDNYGLMSYQGDNVLDIEELEIFADRVVIGSPLWFPGTNVTIHARELQFGADGQIKTTPSAFQSRAQSRYKTKDDKYPATDSSGTTPRYEGEHGLDGEAGGSIKLYVRNLTQPGGWKPERLVTSGSAGQEAEPGDKKPYEPKKPDQPTAAEGKDLAIGTGCDAIKNFLAEIMPMAKQPSEWKWPDGFAASGNSLTGPSDWGNVVGVMIVACDDSFFSEDTNYLWLPKKKRGHRMGNVTVGEEFRMPSSWRDRAIYSGDDAPPRLRPGDGGDAYPGGKPGKGGNAGAIAATVPLDVAPSMRPYYPGSLYLAKGGAAGPETPGVPGDAKGTPAPARWAQMVIVKVCDASIRSRPARCEFEDVTAQDGKPADPVRNVAGQDGTVSQITAPWMAGEMLDAVIACAQDAYRNGHRDLAMSLLDPYYHEFRSAGAGLAEFQDRLVIIEGMRDNLLRNTDFYGNPPGWLPRLNLTSTLDIFMRVRGISAELMYFAQTMGDKYENMDQANRLAEKGTAAVQADMNENVAELKKAYGLVQKTREELDAIEREVKLKEAQIALLKNWAEQKALNKIQEQRIFKGVMKVVGGALKMVPVGQPYVGLAGDVVSGVGDFDWTNPANIPAQVSSTFSKVGGLANTFLEDNKDLIADDAAAPLARTAATATATTTRLTEQVRLANGAVAAHETAAAASRKRRVAQWEKDHKTELAQLKTDETELAKIEETIKTLELEQTERDRLTTLLKKKYGDELGGEAAEGLLEQRMLLTEAVNKTKARHDRARAGIEQDALARAQRKLEALQGTAAGLSEELEQAKFSEAGAATELEAKKKQYGETVTRLKKIGDGVSSIGAGIATLMGPPTTSDTDVQNLANMLLLAENRAEYEKLLREARELSGRLAVVMAKFNSAQQMISACVSDITKNLSELDALSHQRQSLSPVLDVRVKRYLKGMDARARDALRWSIYTLVMAFRYEALEDVSSDFYNVHTLVTKIRGLQAAAAGAGSGGVARESALAWPDFANIDDQVFRSELFEMAHTMLKQRQQFAGGTKNDFPIALPQQELATLHQTGAVTFNTLRDFQVGLGFDKVKARITDIDLDAVALTLPSSSNIQSFRVVFRHSGQSIVKAPNGSYYYFRQAPEQNPISWGFSYDPRATDATKRIVKDTPDTAEDDQLNRFLKTKNESDLIKFKEYYPSLFSDITLSFNPRTGSWNPRDIEKLSELKFRIHYKIAE
jgi:hypothetical protein